MELSDLVHQARHVRVPQVVEGRTEFGDKLEEAPPPAYVLLGLTIASLRGEMN